MKLLVVSTDYPSKGRPVFVFVEQLVQHLLLKGVEVVVVAPQSLTHAIIHKKALRPRVNLVTSRDGIKYRVYRPYCLSAGDNYPRLTQGFNALKTKNIEQIVKKEQPDVLYAHFWENAEVIDGIARKYELPLFVACGEGDNAIEMMLDRMSVNRKQELAKTVTGMISVSSENKRKCLAYGLCREDNVVVLPNCVETSLFKADRSLSIRKKLGVKDDDFLIVFCGDFEARKGSNRLAEAITLLNDDKIKSVFIGHSVGDDSAEPQCEGIVYKGSVAHDELPKYLNSADIFVLPTRKEGCCNAIVEALACGLPVVSSDGAFNDDILDKNNSIRVNPDDVNAIAMAIKDLRCNVDKRCEMAESTVKRYVSYSLQTRAHKIVEFIECCKNKLVQ